MTSFYSKTETEEEVKKEAAQVNFESFNFNENIKRGIDAAGFKVASPIQALSIPLILDGRDMITVFDIEGGGGGDKLPNTDGLEKFIKDMIHSDTPRNYNLYCI